MSTTFQTRTLWCAATHFDTIQNPEKCLFIFFCSLLPTGDGSFCPSDLAGRCFCSSCVSGLAKQTSFTLSLLIPTTAPLQLHLHESYLSYLSSPQLLQPSTSSYYQQHPHNLLVIRDRGRRFLLPRLALPTWWWFCLFSTSVARNMMGDCCSKKAWWWSKEESW